MATKKSEGGCYANRDIFFCLTRQVLYIKNVFHTLFSLLNIASVSKLQFYKYYIFIESHRLKKKSSCFA